MSSAVFDTRPYVPGPADDPLVYSSWLRQIRGVPQLDLAHHRTVVARLLERHGATIACNPADPTHIYGYACCGAPSTLHFVYVRNTFRCYGIGSALLHQLLPGFREQVTYHTHQTRAVRHLKDKWMLRFDPYRVMTA